MAVLASIFVLVSALLQAAQPAPKQAPKSTSETGPIARSQQTGDAGNRTLVLPHTLRKGETAWLLVEVGAIGHNQIQLTTQDGRPLGTVSPYGIKPGQAGGTYTLPMPAETFAGRRLALRIMVKESDRAQHAPTAEEVKSLRLLIRRFRTVH
jgi:hypothetical protein